MDKNGMSKLVIWIVAIVAIAAIVGALFLLKKETPGTSGGTPNIGGNVGGGTPSIIGASSLSFNFERIDSTGARTTGTVKIKNRDTANEKLKVEITEESGEKKVIYDKAANKAWAYSSDRGWEEVPSIVVQVFILQVRSYLDQLANWREET